MLACKSYWVNNSNDNVQLDYSDNGVTHFLYDHIPDSESKRSAFEFGFYPGNFIPYIHQKGYQINGIDFHPNSINLTNKLTKEGLDIGDLFYDDISKFNFTDKSYDLVYSIGFIEHFENWSEIIDLHCSLVKPGGRLILTCPNFRSIPQRIYHWIWDRASFKVHYIPSMNPLLWSQILIKHGFRIEYHGYFGGNYYWDESNNSKKHFTYSSKTYVALSNLLNKVLPVKVKGNFQFNCFCGIVATRY